MQRIKHVVLAAFAVLALIAVTGAAAASAHSFRFDQYPANLSGSVTSTPTISWSGGLQIACGSGSEFIGSAEKAVRALTPSVISDPTGCKKAWPWNTSATVQMNGCKFIFHPGPEESSKGTFDIGPAGCGPVKLTEEAVCTKLFAAQSGMPATFVNETVGGKDAVGISTSASLKYTVEKEKFECKNGTVTYTAGWRLKATNAGGSAIGVHVTQPRGLYLTGKESAEEANQPKFAAEEYPEAIEGDQSASNKHMLTVAGGRRLENCDHVGLLSTITGATNQLALNVEYSGCTANILGAVLPATMQSNSCYYVLHAQNAGPPYTGSLDIACAKEGDAMEMKVYKEGTVPSEGISVCTFKFGAQSLATPGIALSNTGAGAGRGVVTAFNQSGIGYTRAQGTLSVCGATTGVSTYVGTSTLHGVK